MTNNTVKNIVVKLYLTSEAYLAAKAKCDEAGISMSTAGSIALRQWEPAHRIRRQGGGDRPKPGPKRALRLPPARQGHIGAPTPHTRV